MKKYGALDAAKFAGVEDKFKDVLKKKSSKEEINELNELDSKGDVNSKIEQIRNDFLKSDFVDISEI